MAFNHWILRLRLVYQAKVNKRIYKTFYETKFIATSSKLNEV